MIMRIRLFVCCVVTGVLFLLKAAHLVANLNNNPTIVNTQPVSAPRVGKAAGGKPFAGGPFHQSSKATFGLKEDKYFDEPGTGDIYGHYDIRFYSGTPLPDAERHRGLQTLIRAYLYHFREMNIETWIAHGTLLGWWWGKEILPWDGDLDVQVWADSLTVLAEKYNRTMHSFTAHELDDAGNDIEVTREYLLDINPYYVQRNRGNWMNVIDARWIDISTGLFVDITGLAQVKPGLWKCKNYHTYRTVDLLPMKEDSFEGQTATIPNRAKEILEAEYHRGALTNKVYEGHVWDPDVKKWVKAEGNSTDAVVQKTASMIVKEAREKKEAEEKMAAVAKKAAAEKKAETETAVGSG